MRKFKHKPTGNIAEEQSTYYIVNKEKPTVPKWIIESGSDWEEITDRKPVVTLQGKDLFEGDKIWMVKVFTYEILESVIRRDADYEHPDDFALIDYFSTRELAEQYVNENKPVYPAYWVESLIQSAVNNMRIVRMHGWAFSNLLPLIDKLKTFKK